MYRHAARWPAAQNPPSVLTCSLCERSGENFGRNPATRLAVIDGIGFRVFRHVSQLCVNCSISD